MSQADIDREVKSNSEILDHLDHAEMGMEVRHMKPHQRAGHLAVFKMIKERQGTHGRPSRTRAAVSKRARTRPVTLPQISILRGA